MASKKQPWPSLHVGDRVRVVRLPTFQGMPGGGLPPETLRLYKKLIVRGRPQRVYWIDEYGSPWISCRFRTRNGQWEGHYLAINDDSWERVRPATK